MSNIWVYLVIGVVAIGAILAFQNVVVDNEATENVGLTTQNQEVKTKIIKQEIIEPDAIFDKVKVNKEEFILGKVNAPITMVEYASLTCSHCAEFHTLTLPLIKKEFIETGKVRLIYRDFPLDQVALTGSMIAHCAGKDRYFAFIQTMFAQQKQWSNDPQPIKALAQIARLGGMTKDKFEKCIKDKNVADAILQKRLDGDKQYKINSVPTILINGKRYSGGLTIEEFRSIVKRTLN
ncbi:MAG: DsbA family protein [Pseudomonadota bacterium]|nr:DsbA family protein [Pseudomonadota bacterium]